MERTIRYCSVAVALILFTGTVQAAQFYHGSFLAGSLYGNGNLTGSGPFAGNSAPLVADYLNKEAEVKNGTNTSTHLYLYPQQMSMWGDLQSTPPTYTDAVAQGGCMYFGSVITGLSDTDYVHLSSSGYYKAPGSSTYLPIFSDSVYIDIGTYSRINNGTILDEITKIIQEPDLSFTLYATGNIYKDWTWSTGSHTDYWPTQEEFDSLLYYDFKFERTIEIYSGGTLVDPSVSPNTGITEGTGITGGTLTQSSNFTGYGTVVPEPATILLLLLSSIGIAIKKFKK
ncbi:PEP-CTERM sorting domain-containing protein [bacterium]|nr:PEP-CTERM sorting domain-containing protein [bacterium]